MADDSAQLYRNRHSSAAERLAVADDMRYTVEMFPTWRWRWYFIIVWRDGVTLRSTKAFRGYTKTWTMANEIAQEARRG